eukprot:UN00040
MNKFALLAEEFEQPAAKKVAPKAAAPKVAAEKKAAPKAAADKKVEKPQGEKKGPINKDRHTKGAVMLAQKHHVRNSMIVLYHVMISVKLNVRVQIVLTSRVVPQQRTHKQIKLLLMLTKRRKKLKKRRKKLLKKRRLKKLSQKNQSHSY